MINWLACSITKHTLSLKKFFFNVFGYSNISYLQQVQNRTDIQLMVISQQSFSLLLLQQGYALNQAGPNRAPYPWPQETSK